MGELFRAVDIVEVKQHLSNLSKETELKCVHEKCILLCTDVG